MIEIMDRLTTRNFLEVFKLPNFNVSYLLNDKNFYKMHRIVLIYFVYGFVLLLTKADPKIIILQNINGSEVIISSWLLPAKNGTSFSLICKMIATEVNGKNKKHFDNRVIWSKKRKKQSIDDLGMVENSIPIPNAILNFKNVSFKDQGIYYCISFTYKQSKALNLIVRPSSGHRTSKKEASNNSTSLAFNQRLKHFVADVVVPHNNNTRNFKYPFPPMVEPSFEEEPPSILSDDYYNNTNGAVALEAHTDPQLFFYVTIGCIFIVTISYAAAKYRLTNHNNETTSNSNNCEPRNQAVTNRNMCSHLVCIQNRSTHPFAECIMGSNDSRLRRSNNENLRTNPHLDLPPTYDNSVDVDILPTYDDSIDLPPTYDDVAANFACKLNNLCGASNAVQVMNSELPPSYDEALSSNNSAQRSIDLNTGNTSNC